LRLIQRQLPEPDPMTLGLSMFSAAARVVRAGETSGYEISIASYRREPAWVDLEIEAFARESRVKRCGYSKRVFVPARSQMTVALTCDWKEDARFGIEGVEFAADEVHRGQLTGIGCHAVTASLRVAGLELHEPLAIVQEFI